MYQIYLRVKNGGVVNLFQTNSVHYAACFCKSKNQVYFDLGSPNRCYFQKV